MLKGVMLKVERMYNKRTFEKGLAIVLPKSREEFDSYMGVQLSHYIPNFDYEKDITDEGIVITHAEPPSLLDKLIAEKMGTPIESTIDQVTIRWGEIVMVGNGWVVRLPEDIKNNQWIKAG